MTERPYRLTVTLDEDSVELLKRLEVITKMAPPSIVAKLFPAHFEELWEYLAWLEQLPPGPGPLRSRGVNLLQSYGPQNLLQGIAKLDPTYRTKSQRFAGELAKTAESSDAPGA